MKFEFGIATRSDDAEIRKLLADNPMPGSVEVAFEREPDYFAGESVMGDRCITAKAVDAATGRIAGILCFASSRRFVDGLEQSVGYIGQARIDHRYRGYLLPLRAAAFVRTVVKKGWPRLWFTAIVGENRTPAVMFAERPRPSFPKLHVAGEFVTFGISTGVSSRRRKIQSQSSLSIRTGAQTGLTAVAEFLTSHGPRRQFFPVYRQADLKSDSRFPGLQARDILVCEDSGGIRGVCAVWDQSSFKQTVVRNYRGSLRAARPVVNLLGPLAGYGRLPAVGDRLRAASLAMHLSSDDDPQVFLSLVTRALVRAHEHGMDYLLVCLCTRDPLVTTAQSLTHIPYRSTLYQFVFEPPQIEPNLAKIPYLEIATL